MIQKLKSSEFTLDSKVNNAILKLNEVIDQVNKIEAKKTLLERVFHFFKKV